MADDRPTADANWPAILERLAGASRAGLSATTLVELADAQFWCDRLDDSIETRREAYALHVADGNGAAAAMTCWRIFYEHFLVGEAAPASGWLERGRSHAAELDDPEVTGWLKLAAGDVAARGGDHRTAIELAEAVVATGRRRGLADLTAMGLQLAGRSRIEAGERLLGLVLLDEAMVAVINDELDPLFTGWVYCNVIATCYHVADLRRATEWSDAAQRWCATLRDGRLYRGLCRVYAAELAAFSGDWAQAQIQVDLACDELTTHDPRYAGRAFYLAGELRRRMGDRSGAEAAFERARQLGHPTQPGNALDLADAGRVVDAIGMLRTALRPAPDAPLPHAQLLSTLVAIAADVMPDDELDTTIDTLAALAARHDAPMLDAMADLARARRSLARSEPGVALSPARLAATRFDELGCPYDAADARLTVATAAMSAGDLETARHELVVARAAFVQLGAESRLGDVERLLDAVDRGGGRDDGRSGGDDGSADSALTARETEVLTLVGDGLTNRAIAAELHLSPHTVARHVSNIRTKLDAPTRTAAVTRGVALGILPTDRADR